MRQSNQKLQLQVVPKLYDLLSSVEDNDILSNVGNQIVMVHWPLYEEKAQWKVNGNWNG